MVIELWSSWFSGMANRGVKMRMDYGRMVMVCVDMLKWGQAQRLDQRKTL